MKKVVLIALALLAVGCASQRRYPVGEIKTQHGEILFWLYDETPGHKQSFRRLADAGYWDTLTFNRVANNFVIQGGCPDTPEGFGDSPYLLQPEFHPDLKHIYGAVGGGRDDNPEKLTAGCQFYIVQRKEGVPRLDGKYVIFGQIFKGFEVLEKIAALPVDSLDAPLQPVNMDVNVVQMTAKQLSRSGWRKTAARKSQKGK